MKPSPRKLKYGELEPYFHKFNKPLEIPIAPLAIKLTSLLPHKLDAQSSFISWNLVSKQSANQHSPYVDFYGSFLFLKNPPPLILYYTIFIDDFFMTPPFFSSHLDHVIPIPRITSSYISSLSTHETPNDVISFPLCHPYPYLLSPRTLYCIAKHSNMLLSHNIKMNPHENISFESFTTWVNFPNIA